MAGLSTCPRFARGRLGGGITLWLSHRPRTTLPGRRRMQRTSGIDHQTELPVQASPSDPVRLGQLFSNPWECIDYGAPASRDRCRHNGRGLQACGMQAETQFLGHMDAFLPFARGRCDRASRPCLGLYIASEIAKGVRRD